MSQRLFAIVAAALSLAACGGAGTPTSPTSPTSPPTLAALTASWSGSISDPISGTGTVQLVFGPPAASVVTGTWSAAFKNGESYSGPAQGQLLSFGYGITLFVQQPLAPCETESGASPSALLEYTLINVSVASNKLTATAGRLSCSGGPLFGTVSLSKQ